MPRLDFWFRLFHHASLGLASVCLLYAEAFFLPTPLLIVLYILAALQIFAFGVDGRRWVLPGWVANLLAGAVAGGGFVWIGIELNSPDSILADLPLPAGLLPYIGPILICLLVVKLFRPRTQRDFWLLQGVGALQVALACVLATSPDSGLLFGLLLAAYIGCALGCLALHYFQEEQSADQVDSRADPAAVRLPFAFRMAPFCVRWTLAVGALAAPLFLLTPRLDGPTWDSASLAVGTPHARPEASVSGFSQTIDLNQDGPVRLGGAEVFRVVVVPAPGEPTPDLSAEQRWRGGVLDTYARGQWDNREVVLSEPALQGARPPALAPPLRPGLYRLDYTVEAHAGGFFLAEPVRKNGAPARLTRVDKVEGLDKLSPLIVSTRGPVLPLLYHGLKEYRYRQTVAADSDPDRSPGEDDRVYQTELLMRQDVPGLTVWTTALLKRLAADPANGLTAADIELAPIPHSLPPPLPGGMPAPVPDPAPPILTVRADARERVARALTAYLARSGEYSYTLDLRRQNSSLDPVMDFLVNVKQGHCERFASALALMLRSQGIPSRIVVGFRGPGELEDGVYVVRQNQAHAWVEMLAARDTLPGLASSTLGVLGAPLGQGPFFAATAIYPGRIGVEWVTLDPTPAADVPPPAPYTLWEWWQDGQRTGQELWGGMIVNYSAEQQADLWATLQSREVLGALIAPAAGLPVLAAVGVLAWFVLRWRRRARAARAAAAPATAGYARLLALLARHAGPRPETGQTPREFAAEARRFLRTLPAAAPFADLPDAIVDLLYRIRFGGQVPYPGEGAAGEARLGELAAALRGAGT